VGLKVDKRKKLKLPLEVYLTNSQFIIIDQADDLEYLE
jgi:hypothetical protein